MHLRFVALAGLIVLGCAPAPTRRSDAALRRVTLALDALDDAADRNGSRLAPETRGLLEAGRRSIAGEARVLEEVAFDLDAAGLEVDAAVPELAERSAHLASVAEELAVAATAGADDAIRARVLAHERDRVPALLRLAAGAHRSFEPLRAPPLFLGARAAGAIAALAAASLAGVALALGLRRTRSALAVGLAVAGALAAGAGSLWLLDRRAPELPSPAVQCASLPMLANELERHPAPSGAAPAVSRAAGACLAAGPDARTAPEAVMTWHRAVAAAEPDVPCTTAADCAARERACDVRLGRCVQWGVYCEASSDCLPALECSAAHRCALSTGVDGRPR